MLWRLSEPPAQTFVSDALEYNGAAYHLVVNGTYSLDGEHPFYKREPGQSLFLAAIYLLFGVENRAAYYAVLFLLYFLSVVAFLKESERSFLMKREAKISFFFLLFLPSVFQILLSFNREGLALSLFLLFATFFLRLHRTRAWRDAIVAGLFLGALMLTYMPFLLFPFALIIPVYAMRMSWSRVLLMIVIAFAVIAPWGIRNQYVAGNPCLSGCSRSAANWYVRGEQAEHLSGFEPVMCLWAEYVSRDWSERSPYCSFNAVKNRKWPHGLMGTTADIQAGKDGQAKIFANFGSYLWFSVVDVLELHIPYVGGWGRLYNITLAFMTFLLYFGCCWAIPFLRKREYVFFGVIMLYTTGIFALTDATPRYLMPVIFCYVLFASIGYNHFLARFSSHAPDQHRHSGV